MNPFVELPSNLDAERATLGSMMLSAQAIDDVAGIITAESFHDERHARVFEIAQELHRAEKPVDLISVAGRLAGDIVFGLAMDEVAVFVGRLAEAVPHASHAKHYAELVREKADRRELGQIAKDIAAAVQGTAETCDIIGQAEQRLHKLLEVGAAGDSLSIGDILVEMEDATSSAVFPTGFADLDELLDGGMRGGWLAILAARPSVGKTALMGNIGLNSGRRDNACEIFSLEQSREELADRLVSSLSRVPASLFKPKNRNRQTESDKSQILQAQSRLARLPIFVNDTGGMTVGQIAAAARLRKRRGGLGLIVVDYLQLVEPDDKRIPREQQVATISRRLKLLAKELEVPVLCLAQLNRAVEARENKRPRLSDLRESGAIEQDADVVMFLHRPAAFDPEADQTEAYAIVAKNRHGKTGDVRLRFDAPTVTFQNLERREVW